MTSAGAIHPDHVWRRLAIVTKLPRDPAWVKVGDAYFRCPFGVAYRHDALLRGRARHTGQARPPASAFNKLKFQAAATRVPSTVIVGTVQALQLAKVVQSAQPWTLLDLSSRTAAPERRQARFR